MNWSLTNILNIWVGHFLIHGFGLLQLKWSFSGNHSKQAGGMLANHFATKFHCIIWWLWRRFDLNQNFVEEWWIRVRRNLSNVICICNREHFSGGVLRATVICSKTVFEKKNWFDFHWLSNGSSKIGRQFKKCLTN